MVEYDGDNIKIVRGDTAYIDFTLLTPEGHVYELQSGERLIFNVRETLTKGINKKVTFSKEFVNNKTSILFDDTFYLNKDEYYYYVEFINKSGEIQTVKRGKFFVLE